MKNKQMLNNVKIKKQMLKYVKIFLRFCMFV